MSRSSSIFMASLLALSLTACSSSTSAASEAAGSASSSVAGSTSEQTAEPAASDQKEITFESLTVVDNDECSIVITELDPDGMFGYTAKAQLENKSADKTYMFAISGAAINGVMFEPLFATDVDPGKKANETITCYDNDLVEEIGDITDIELTFRVYDDNDWTADAVAEETVHVYPYGEENATVYTRADASTDNVIIDNDTCKVIVTSYDPDGLFGYTVNLYLINKTDSTLMFSVDSASINGYMADPFWASEVLPGKTEYTSMQWTDTTLEENAIETVEEIELQFRVSDSNDWMADPYVEETITLQP